MREYQKRGKSEKYLKLDQEFSQKYRSAAKKFNKAKNPKTAPELATHIPSWIQKSMRKAAPGSS